MDRTSSGTIYPRHYTITWGIYCLQRWALQRSWRPGCPASPPQSDTLTLSLIHHLLCINIYQHASQCFKLTTQFWTLKESGALCSLGQGLNSPSPLQKNHVKLILYYSAQCYKAWGTVPLIRYLQNKLSEHSSRWPLKDLSNLQKHLRIVLQRTIYRGILSLLSL